MNSDYSEYPYQLIFIVGSGRFGTTLLRNALGENESVLILPETNFFSKLYSRRILNRTGKGLIDLFAEPLARIGKGLRYDPIWNDVDLKKLKETAVFNSYNTFLDSIINFFIGANKKVKFVVEKTPGHLFYLTTICKLYPNAKIIYIQRDIKQVVNSYLKFQPDSRMIYHF